jgi:D-3-phosphoglycerate dehydrogenase
MKKVIFINRPHPILQEKLEGAGYFCEDASLESREEILKRIQEYTGIIINSRFFLDQEFLSQATALKFIARVGSGMESIDTDYAASRGIQCFNSPEGNRDAVGERGLGLLLALLNHIPRADREVHQLQWRREENRGHEIKGKTVGIIGYGNMGSAFARKLSGFEATIIAYDKYKRNFSNSIVTECSLNELFEKADILSFHVPLTQETRYYFNAAFLAKFNKDIWVLNTSRGKVLETAALVEGLRSGKVLGAALDVLEYEDVSFDKPDISSLPQPLKDLLEFDNVVLSPHVAGWTVESKYKLAKVLADKILKAQF